MVITKSEAASRAVEYRRQQQDEERARAEARAKALQDKDCHKEEEARKRCREYFAKVEAAVHKLEAMIDKELSNRYDPSKPFIVVRPPRRIWNYVHQDACSALCDRYRANGWKVAVTYDDDEKKIVCGLEYTDGCWNVRWVYKNENKKKGGIEMKGDLEPYFVFA